MSNPDDIRERRKHILFMKSIMETLETAEVVLDTDNVRMKDVHTSLINKITDINTYLNSLDLQGQEFVRGRKKCIVVDDGNAFWLKCHVIDGNGKLQEKTLSKATIISCIK